MSEPKYKIFTSGSCPWCVKAINVMAKVGPAFDVVSLKGNPKAIAYLQNRNLKTVPQIFHGKTHIGGYEDMVVHLTEKGYIK